LSCSDKCLGRTARSNFIGCIIGSWNSDTRSQILCSVALPSQVCTQLKDRGTSCHSACCDTGTGALVTRRTTAVNTWLLSLWRWCSKVSAPLHCMFLVSLTLTTHRRLAQPPYIWVLATTTTNMMFLVIVMRQTLLALICQVCPLLYITADKLI